MSLDSLAKIWSSWDVPRIPGVVIQRDGSTSDERRMRWKSTSDFTQ